MAVRIGKGGESGRVPHSEELSVRSNIGRGGDEAAQSNAQFIPPFRSQEF